MSESKTGRTYPPEMALRVVLTGKSDQPYEVKYSLPENERIPRDWKINIDGLPILIEKKHARELDKLVVDMLDGEYVICLEEELQEITSSVG